MATTPGSESRIRPTRPRGSRHSKERSRSSVFGPTRGRPSRFFRGLETRGGRIEDQGPVTIDGVACQKVAFVHAENIIFYRYFDLATGRLTLTETEAGGTLREQGELIAAGLRFPKSLVTTAKNPAGKVQTVTITVEKITVNEVFPASFFAVPIRSLRE